MLLAFAAALVAVAQVQPPSADAWRTFTYPDGKEMRFLPPQFSESDYPPSALRSGIQGRTLLRLVVSPAGRLLECTIQESSGSAELDARACDVYRARARFELRNFTANHIVRAPVRWQLEGRAPTPAVAVPAATAQAFMLRRGGAGQLPVTLGREFQVTQEMVTRSIPSSFLPMHENELVLHGRRGDRFALSWRSENSFSVTHPSGSIEPGSYTSVTITLVRDGENSVVLKQPHRFTPYVLLVRSDPAAPHAGVSQPSPNNRMAAFASLKQELERSRAVGSDGRSTVYRLSGDACRTTLLQRRTGGEDLYGNRITSTRDEQVEIAWSTFSAARPSRFSAGPTVTLDLEGPEGFGLELDGAERANRVARLMNALIEACR